MEKECFVATGLLIYAGHEGVQRKDGEVFSDHADLLSNFSSSAEFFVTCSKFRLYASSTAHMLIGV